MRLKAGSFIPDAKRIGVPINGQVISSLQFHELRQCHVVYAQRDKSIMRDEMITTIMDIQHQ